MRPTKQHSWFTNSGKVMAALGAVGARYDLPDRLTFPKHRPVLLAGNHRSLLDLVATMAIFTKFDLSTHILVKEAYMKSGPGAWYLRSIGCIPTSRDRREEAEAAAIASLQQGHLVSMMPEGRVTSPEDWTDGVGPGRPGVSRIATAADAVVVPVGFRGTEEVWPKGRMPRLQWPRPTVSIRLGEPIEMTSSCHETNTREVMAGISDLVA